MLPHVLGLFYSNRDWGMHLTFLRKQFWMLAFVFGGRSFRFLGCVTRLLEMRFRFLPKLSTKTKSGTILMYLGPHWVGSYTLHETRSGLKSVVHRRVHFISVSVVSSLVYPWDLSFVFFLNLRYFCQLQLEVLHRARSSAYTICWGPKLTAFSWYLIESSSHM